MDLIVDDDYIKELGQYFEEQGKYIEEFTDEYNAILQRVVDGGIIKGKMAEALEEFMNQVWANTEVSFSTYEDLGVKLNRFASGFKDEIDAADGGLYN